MSFFSKSDKTVEENTNMSMRNEETEIQEDKTDNIVKMPKRKAFQVWEVGSEVYKMKLGTAEIAELEMKYKTNLMNIMGAGQGGMPALTTMLDVAHAAMKKYNHSIKRKELDDMFDRYIDEGGSQLNFYTEIYMGIFSASGFFSNALADQMEDALEEAKEVL